jgi:hypothetical protein
MFNNHNFPQLLEQDPDLNIYKAINKFKLHKVIAHVAVFSCAESISWIVKHVSLDQRLIIDARVQPMAYLYPSMVSSCYHLNEGELALDNELVKEFSQNPKELMKIWCYLGKYFRTRSSDDYPTNCVRLSYQYEVSMVCKIYGEIYEQDFKVSWVPLLHFVTSSGSSFNWPDILS